MHGSFLHLAGLMMLCWISLGSAYAVEWAKIAARDNRATVLLNVEWQDAEGFKDGSGTGFVIDEKMHILTVAHIIPREPVTNLLITGRTEKGGTSYPKQEFRMRVVQIDRNQNADFAILVPDTDTPVLTPVPIADSWVASERVAVYVRGFPLGGLLNGKGGYVTRTEMSPEVPTDILLQSGFSGGPVYQDDGSIIGMARGGVPVADIKDPTVMGNGYFVPVSIIRSKFIEEVRSGLLETAKRFKNSPSQVALVPLTEIRMSYQIDVEKLSPTPLLRGIKNGDAASILEGLLYPDRLAAEAAVPAETKSYTSGKIRAQPGYRIVSYEYLEHSATALSSKQFIISSDGDWMEMAYSLTSGPGSNQTRGWLDATIATKQIAR